MRDFNENNERIKRLIIQSRNERSLDSFKEEFKKRMN